MKRSKNEIEGQLCFNMCLESTLYVAQHNDLIEARHNLNLNSAKIIRLAIMQIKPDDDELKPYVLKAKEFAELIGVSKYNLYRDAYKIADDIISHPVEIKLKNDRFIKIPWVQLCTYDRENGFGVKLNDLLKPYLLQLKAHYTQYQIDAILAMKSVYAIRIFELLQEDSVMRYVPKNGAVIDLKINDIRVACDCVSKFERFSNFKSKVLDIAVSEINRCTIYDVSCECLSLGKGKAKDTARFHVNVWYH